MSPLILLRLEGLAALAGAGFAYAHIDANWWLFAALFLLPDLFMLGYFAGPRIGAAIYNAGHTYLLPAGLALAGLPLPLALIWAAHIGFDRALGYGLKHREGFRATHLTTPPRSP